MPELRDRALPFRDESLDALVRRFYGEVRADPLLGPVFAARIDDWEPHLARMVAFWTTVLRAEPAFRPSDRGSPAVIHRGIGELERAHFARWLALFEPVARETLSAEEARVVIAKARRMGRALSAHLPGAAAP